MAEAEDDAPQRASDSGGGTTSLFLSLYLLLLAFFILLNTISTYEEVKARKVQQSLSSAFASILPPTTSLDTVTSVDGPRIAAEETQQKLGDLFKSPLNIARVEVLQPGKLLEVMMHTDQLFEPGKDTIRERQRGFVANLAAALANTSGGAQYEMEMMLGSNLGKHGTVPVEGSLEISRAGAFARAVIAAGAPARTIDVGIDPSADPFVVTFRFFWDQTAAAKAAAVRAAEAKRAMQMTVPLPALPKNNVGGPTVTIPLPMASPGVASGASSNPASAPATAGGGGG
ncbi:hypothetical protein [Thalassospira sp. TSL5-1]|uniref:hypothetical protein n=1 Tax=Thalassospira sp. TSL5-1 TaxID=1544451 RepID=UPI0009391FF8|nr:hypothetical protein [Thalassospira sp. TSL5-1]